MPILPQGSGPSPVCFGLQASSLLVKGRLGSSQTGVLAHKPLGIDEEVGNDLAILGLSFSIYKTKAA